MSNANLNIILSLQDKASKELAEFKGKVEGMQPTFSKMASIGAIGFTALAGAIGFASKEAIDAEANQHRLATILKTTHDATREQIDALNDQAKALEAIGVVSGDNVTVTQSQLATFDLQVDTIKSLTPAILDYVIAEKGATATSEDFKAMTNGLAQALQGNFASLTRTGFVLDDATKAMISNGTEAEKASALVDVLNSTYKDFNVNATQTAQGSLQVLRNQFGAMAEEIGVVVLPMLIQLVDAVKPLIMTITTWISENQGLTLAIIAITGGLFGLLAIIGTLGLVLPAIIAGFGLLSSTVFIVIGIIAGLVLAISNVSKIMYILQHDMGLVWSGIKVMFQEAVNWIIDKTLQPLLDFIDKIVSALNRIKDGAGSILGKVGGAIKGGVSKITKVNDAIISPNGNIISTHPDDYLIATKNPQSLGKGGGDIIITGNTFMGTEDMAEKVGDLIMRRLKTSSVL
jgi:hypothetical protein